MNILVCTFLQTTFLQHIVGKDYPGMRIGPEPTTDKFIVIMNGKEDSIVPGHTNFSNLSSFSNSVIILIYIDSLFSLI